MAAPSSKSGLRSPFAVLFFILATSIQAHAQETMAVSVVIARQAGVEDTIPVVGSLVAREEVEVMPRVAGVEIEHILADRGQYVERGQPLALLDTTDARMRLDKNAVAALRADAAVEVEASRLAVALVREAESRKLLDRSRSLQPRGVVSQQLLDEHENAFARMVAETRLARQSLVLAQADREMVVRERRDIELTIERSTVRAPQAGLVLRRSARLGAMTSDAAAPLFVLARDAAIEFSAQVTEVSFVRLAEGMTARISLPGQNDPVDGIVRLSAAELDPATRSGEVRIELDGADGLRPGIFGRGTIEGATRRNILLPGSALKTTDGGSSVFVVEEGVVGLRAVTVGVRHGGLVEILSGVDDGDMVVLKAGGFLKEEERVRPVVAHLDQDDGAERIAALRSLIRADGERR